MVDDGELAGGIVVVAVVEGLVTDVAGVLEVVTSVVVEDVVDEVVDETTDVGATLPDDVHAALMAARHRHAHPASGCRACGALRMPSSCASPCASTRVGGHLGCRPGHTPSSAARASTRSRSAPMVVLSPWPVCTTVWSGSASRRSRIERRIVGSSL